MLGMATNSRSNVAAPVWGVPTDCPFCGEGLADGGAAFMDHIAESPSCEAGFERWRGNVAGDVGGEWSG